MPNYYGYSPAQYYSQRANRKESQIQNIMNMIMQSKLMQQKRGQQDWERGMEEKRYELSERDVASRELRAGKETRPTMAQMKYDAVMKDPNVSDEDKAYYDKHHKLPDKGKLPGSIRVWAMKKYGHTAREVDSMDENSRRSIRDEYEMTHRKDKPTDYDKRITAGRKAVGVGAMTPEAFGRLEMGLPEEAAGGAITPSLRITNRRMIGGSVRKTFNEIRNLNPKDFKDPEKIAEWRQVGIELDMPVKYSEYNAMKKVDPRLLSDAEVRYMDKVEATRDIIKEKGITDKSTLDKKFLRLLDGETLDLILGAIKKEKKYFWQK